MEGKIREPIISAVNITKHYGGVLALDGVTTNIYPGEILAIVGDNGAGKSTFINILSGSVSPDENSEIYFEGKRVAIKNPKDANQLGIYTVYQDLALCNNLNAFQNIFLGREITKGGQLVKPHMERKAIDLFNNIGSNIPNPEAPVSTRSGGQRQAVAIARALLITPKVILLDEPTAALGVIQRKQVSTLTKRLREENCAVVLVSQDLREVAKSADRVLVFRLGKIEAELTGDLITRENMVAHITGAVGEKAVK